MNVILDVVKCIAFLVLCNSAFLKVTLFTFPWRSEWARPRALKMFKVEFITKPKNPAFAEIRSAVHGIKR